MQRVSQMLVVMAMTEPVKQMNLAKSENS